MLIASLRHNLISKKPLFIKVLSNTHRNIDSNIVTPYEFFTRLLSLNIFSKSFSWTFLFFKLVLNWRPLRLHYAEPPFAVLSLAPCQSSSWTPWLASLSAPLGCKCWNRMLPPSRLCTCMDSVSNKKEKENLSPSCFTLFSLLPKNTCKRLHKHFPRETRHTSVEIWIYEGGVCACVHVWAGSRETFSQEK